MIKVPLSILELAVISEHFTIAQTFEHIGELAKQAEEIGYKRFWLAEHHNMESVASSATTVLIAFIASRTKTIQVGSGGIMLPNHSPLMVAEQFGTLATLYPQRINLGLGRAPGTDPVTSYALRRNTQQSAENFPKQVSELLSYFSADNYNSAVRAIPGEGMDIPVWILGSSTDSAYLAAEMGLPYAFASHFAPAQLHQALQIYHQNFKPSARLEKPYTMAAVNAIVADTAQKASFLATSFQQLARGIITGDRKPLPPPVSDMSDVWSPYEAQAVTQLMLYSFIGDPKTVAANINEFVSQTRVDEVIVTSHIYDFAARLNSFRLLGQMVAQ